MEKNTEIIDLLDMPLLTKDETRDFISKFEEKLLAGEHVDMPLKHHFSKGVYAREIFIPKGTYIVGKIHKHQNLNILSQGELSIISIEGVARVKAPMTVVSPPGVKRLAYAHEDCIWTTIHGTDETDLEIIESEFIAKNYDEVIEHSNKKEITAGV